MQNASEGAVEGYTAFMACDYLKVNAFTRYVRGIQYVQNGVVYVAPVGLDKSSAMVTLKDANCLIVIPPTKTEIRAGEIVQTIPLRGAMIP
jgi:molybdopterin molybdotransferase